MSDIAIKAENLGKSYLIGHFAPQAERYSALRDVIARSAHNFIRKTSDMFHGKAIVQGDEVEEYWALKDINFEIKQGDRVGIIGRNGAGKSTLLKILSRITEPTAGRVTIKGRVASLLEVGTGFHPELTGRENIFLNGAILGMSRQEIQRKFDEIVDFAEVEKFLDTPVKRYSSGMYVRLAFAVAAHLETEILIVDEVLAVGDAAFQQKCLGKMENVSNSGRTVLFVSHNIVAISRLCKSAILLENGNLSFMGQVEAATSLYSKVESKTKATFKNGPIYSISAEQVENGIEILASYNKNLPIKIPCLGFVISDNMGNPICGTNPIVDANCKQDMLKNTGVIKVLIKNPRLHAGDYKISLWFGDGIEEFFIQRDCLTLNISDNLSLKPLPSSSVGSILPECEWSTNL